MISGMKRHSQFLPITAIVLVLLASICYAGDIYQAKVVGIADGDTVKVFHNGQQVRIRLYGIDTPESHQAFGNRAKQFTADQVFGKRVLVTPIDMDRYGRTVAMVQILGDKVSLNEELVAAGYTWVYRKYCKAPFCADWLYLEQDARIAGRGLWADPNPVQPWEFSGGNNG
jgi:endonuclease YncB( thermonuclease family)